MFTNYRILDIFDYICVRNAQCWARITKSDMEIQHYNRLKIVQVEKVLAHGSQSRWVTASEVTPCLSPLCCLSCITIIIVRH